ncbi:thymidine kinase cytosolic [Anaeramoeba flamelloides]|uniref:thymidine kinase n=1 Tax=Anaeramoeba flamelloides TaxID=1746091 RepID=A0AAV8A6C2_9EUKA|nr:thymidine kinase cytosolic [Anaeramoeba flamelloides]
MDYSGKIGLIIGPVFSGKTSELIRIINRYSYASKKCLIIKFSEESETTKKTFKTHSGYPYQALATDDLSRVVEQVKGNQIIGIDDGQFFPQIADFAEDLANQGKVVYIAALDGTFERKPFDCITQLIPRCESVVKLSSVCKFCSEESSFSKRLTNDKQIKLLGGLDKYISVCRREYFKVCCERTENHKNNINNEKENKNKNKNKNKNQNKNQNQNNKNKNKNKINFENKKKSFQKEKNTAEYTYEGHIQLILGPMFGGKSSELIRRTRRYSFANKKCTVIKFARDIRYSVDKCCTHDKVMMDAVPCTGKLFEVEDKVKDHDVIGIDEGQFFEDVVEFSEHMANLGKIVIVASLDGTFERKPFGRVLELVSKAEKVIKLNAICMVTYKDAAFSKRISQEKEVQVIGGSDKYIAVSREGYFKN